MKELQIQKIFDILQGVLPKQWKRVAFYAEYTEGSYSMKYYVDLDNGIYINCYALSQYSKAQFVKAFMDIDKEISAVRNELTGKDKWSVLTLLVDADGNFKCEFDYTDTKESTIEYHEKWKKKYLI